MKKKIINKILVAAGLAVMLSACKKTFLENQPLNSIPGAATWGDPALSEAFLTNAYNGLSNGGWEEQELASLSDEAVFVHPGRGIDIINEGLLSATNPGWSDNSYEWGQMYDYIRTCNLVLENVRNSVFTDTTLAPRLLGEAHFLRGYFYQQLLRYYGGVPLVIHSYSLGQDYSIARNTYEDCVNFITAECDSATTLLTGKTLLTGRATPIAAMALKSRVLLYAASDLHDMPTAKANSALLAGFSNPELLGYVSGDRAARWQAAQAASLAVLNAANGYKLNLGVPETQTNAINNYESMAMGGASKASNIDAAASSELLFQRQFSNDLFQGGPGTDGTSVGLDNGPNGYNNWAGNVPIQELVDDYEMMDGTKFSWSTPAQAAHPYVNRDPRFYATILFDGANWKPRDLVNPGLDKANQIQSGYYETAPGILGAGLDTRGSSVQNWNASWSAYYMRKFIDPNPAVVDASARQYIPYPVIRYTEVVFNYIESCLALGDETNAKLWLNRIRYRAGMPTIVSSGDALVQEYRNERRIEMAFEEQRYHDCRRWMIASSTLGRKLVFVSITGRLIAGKTALVPYQHDETVWNYNYSTYNDNTLEDRLWTDKMYYRPMYRSELNENTKLIQNPGY